MVSCVLHAVTSKMCQWPTLISESLRVPVCLHSCFACRRAPSKSLPHVSGTSSAGWSCHWQSTKPKSPSKLMLAKTLGWMAVVLPIYQWSCQVIICKLYMIKGQRCLATIRPYAFRFSFEPTHEQAIFFLLWGNGSVPGVMGRLSQDLEGFWMWWMRPIGINPHTHHHTWRWCAPFFRRLKLHHEKHVFWKLWNASAMTSPVHCRQQINLNPLLR